MSKSQKAMLSSSKYVHDEMQQKRDRSDLMQLKLQNHSLNETLKT